MAYVQAVAEPNYTADTIANSYKRLKEMYPEQEMILYGISATTLCCNPVKKADSINLIVPYGRMLRVDTHEARAKGFELEHISSRAIRFYDYINSLEIKMGMDRAEFISTSSKLAEQSGFGIEVLMHSFMGVSVRNITENSIVAAISGTCVRMPSVQNQLALLYSEFLCGTRKSDEAILSVFSHHFRNTEELSSIGEPEFGIWGLGHAKALKEGINSLLRS